MTVMELFSLQGKTAIVTGGGRGLGHKLPKALPRLEPMLSYAREKWRHVRRLLQLLKN